MKTMKKFWTVICSCLCALACVLGITVHANVKASAATANDVSITYACIQYTANDGTGVPKTYTFVTNLEGATTSTKYDTTVYVDGQKMDAWMQWGCFYIDANAFDCEVGDTLLVEIPAGTYYQTNAYVANDIKLFISLTDSYTNPDHGAYHNQSVFDIADASNIISKTPYAIELYKLDWAINATNAGNLYLRTVDPNHDIKSGTEADWSNHAKYKPLGNALTLNGKALTSELQKVYADNGAHKEAAYMSVSGVSKPGDVLTFNGWFHNATYGAFRVDNVSFIYDGKSWDEVNAGTYDFDVSTTSDANPQNGFYLSMPANHIPVSTESSGWAYSTRPAGSNFYGYYNGASNEIKFRKFSATDWYVALNESGIDAVSGDVITFGGWYVCTDASAVQHFIKLNTASYQFDGTKWTEVTPTYNVTLNGVEVEGDYLYVTPGQYASDVEATASNGNAVTINLGSAVKDGRFVLRNGESSSEYVATLSVTDANGAIYRKEMAVRVGFEDFIMEEGAAVRVVNDNVNGLRFSAEMSATTYENLTAQGASFGIVIVPRDYVTAGYELTAANLFGVNAKYSTSPTGSQKRMLNLDGLMPEDKDKDGRYEIYGAITDILRSNLTREFVGIAYVCVNGEYIIASFSGNELENNARSIYYVAQRAVDANDHADKVTEKYLNAFDAYLTEQNANYNVNYTINHIRTRKGTTEVETVTGSAPLNSVIEISANTYDGFTLSSFVSSVSMKLYANKDNVFDFYYKDISLPNLDTTAWHHPKLDATNGYMNNTNKAIVETMSAAGFTSVMLNGSHTVGDLYLNSPANIEAMKQIINMYWTYGGITTYVSGKNAGTADEYVSLEDYQELQAEMASLLDCDGFGGFFAWDEPLPNAASFERIAEYAAWFDGLYGDEATFMVNLFPSYYDKWSSGEYQSYSAYIKAYCDIVLPNIVNGTKYLSMDSYPIYADGTLMQNYMYDLAVLKHYALEYDAHANAIMQACGWNSTNNYVVPTEAQYRLLHYTALAFGMDSVGWWGYSPEQENPTVILPDQTPVKIDGTTTAAYDAIKAVNTEIAGFGSIYKTYDWQGVIMSSPSKGFITIGKDAQYDAFNKVKSDSLLSKYMLSASNTSSFSSISGSGSNYVVGVMKDNNNNEAFTVVNYSAPKDNKTLSLTFKANANGQYTIYKNGEMTTVSITTSGYTLELAPGEGAFIVSANTTHTVTFKNWDGTVLHETTCQIGNTPVYSGAEPTKDGHTFAGWTPALGAITGDTVYTATFKGMPTITFKNWDGTVLQESTWAYGTTPSYSGATPTKNGAEFAGWTPEITTVTGDAVYTARFNEKFTVTYYNYDGVALTARTKTVTSGNAVSIVEPKMNGYIFMGWTLNGEPYDLSTPVTDNITLIASWCHEMDNGVDEVKSAQDVYDNTQLEAGYGIKESGSYANGNAGWYFDSDYNGNTGAGGTDDNKFMNMTKFTLTVDGGSGSSAEGRETYITLPAIDYRQYSKVDFAYINPGNVSAITIYGTEVKQFGGNNKLISIVTTAAANGTFSAKLYFRELNSVVGDVTVGAQATITLPAKVVNGRECLTLNFKVTGWTQVQFTEFHMTRTAGDYLADLETALAALESDVTNTAALDAYLTAESYMTAYEKVGYTRPAIVKAAQEIVYYNAVVNATAGSSEQAAAIEEYRSFMEVLDEADRNEVHIAEINAIIYANFYELGEEQILLNDPIVDTSKGAVDQNERIQTGWGGHSTDYKTTYATYVHMIQYTSGAYDGTITLPAINYNAYVEAYFGLRAITADGIGTITIGDGSYSFDNSKNHNWKVTINGKLLTVSDDNKSNNDGGGVLWTTILSDEVASGAAGLVIDCNFEAWTQVEVTEMRVTPLKTETSVITNAVSSIISGGQAKGEKNITHAQNSNSKFKGTKYETFSYRQNSSNTEVTFTLSALDYASYNEVRFGVAFAVTGSQVGTLTIGGATLAIPESLIGHTYIMEAVIADGYLTLVDYNCSNDIKTQDTNYAQYGYFLRVQLSESVLNGAEGLKLAYTMDAAYAWFEVTELHVTTKSAPMTFVTVCNNAVTMEMSGTTVNNSLRYDASSYWGTGAHTAFNTSYTSQNLVSFNAADAAYNVAFTMPKFDFTKYNETYFGFTAATAAGDTTVTINGTSYTYDLNAGYVYVKMLVKDGVLTVVGDGASNAGAVYMTVELTEGQMNGTEAIVIEWSTAGWSQVEITELHAVAVANKVN